MLTQFKDHIARHDLFGQHDRILLAVSGGLDSMVMLCLFKEAGYQIGVAHSNFGLREEESDGDEAFVKDYCLQAGIPFYHQRFPTKNYAGERKISIQMAARELRYDWFGKILVDEKYHWLATAHHLNDNLETVLLRWINGTGLDQLMGIPVKNDKVVRPLLFATRSEIKTYADANNIPWREDSSNVTSDYQRNFVRHHIVPKLKELNPSLEETFSVTTDKLKGAYEQMLRGLGQLKDTLTRLEGRNFLIDKGLLLLIQNPVFVSHEWLREYGFEWDRCEQLVAALAAQPGKRFYSATHEAIIDREFIIVSPLEEALQEILIEEGQDKAMLGPWMLTLRREENWVLKTDKFQAAFDFGKLKFPLLWRKWRSGDSFFPLGMRGRKKVSDFLIDEKVPVNEKSRVTVVESSGEIAWVAGYRIDDRFKVTDTTNMTFVIQIAMT